MRALRRASDSGRHFAHEQEESRHQKQEVCHGVGVASHSLGFASSPSTTILEQDAHQISFVDEAYLSATLRQLPATIDAKHFERCGSIMTDNHNQHSAPCR